jgi:SnoaL-like protein
MNETLARRFIALYANMDSDSIAQLDSIYAEDVVFADPFHKIDGLIALQNYLRGQYRAVNSARFECQPPAICGSDAYIRWQLLFSHPHLQSGREIAVPGISFIRGAARISYHEDFYDAGALLYEHIPLLGSGVRFLKRRMQHTGESS